MTERSKETGDRIEFIGEQIDARLLEYAKTVTAAEVIEWLKNIEGLNNEEGRNETIGWVERATWAMGLKKEIEASL